MTASFANSTTATAASGTTLTLAKPSGTVVGNLLVAMFNIQASSAPVITAPAGWDSRGVGVAFSARMAVFTRIAGSSEPANYAFTTDLDITTGSGVLVRYSAPKTIVIGNYAFTSSSNNPAIAPSIVTAQPNAKLLCAFLTRQLGSGVSGMTQRAVLDNGTSDIGAFDQTIASSGATGSRTYTGSTDGHGFSLSIEEQESQNRIRMMI